MSYKRSKTVIVDLQFVVGNEKTYHLKELVILKGNSTSRKHYLFKPPFPECELNTKTQWQNNYNYQNINKLSWSQGYVAYDFVPRAIAELEDYKTIIVKGEQKKLYLEQYLPSAEIIDLDIGCSLDTLPVYDHDCPVHESSFPRCAVANVFKILLYMHKNDLLIN